MIVLLRNIYGELETKDYLLPTQIKSALLISKECVCHHCNKHLKKTLNTFVLERLRPYNSLVTSVFNLLGQGTRNQSVRSISFDLVVTEMLGLSPPLKHQTKVFVWYHKVVVNGTTKSETSPHRQLWYNYHFLVGDFFLCLEAPDIEK